MPPQSRPSLRLVHAQDSPENAMLRANKHLSEVQPKEAIKIYTEILYKLSPGHICAFLNRSLAYLCLNMPELAVIDAYRAGIAANQVREDENNGLSRYQAVTKFLRAENLAVDGGEAWTSERRRFVQGGWAYSALSTLVINDIPEFEDPTAVKCARFSINKRQVVCMALEIRAIYRLCGALYMCGGGARSDALGLIDDAHKRCTGMEDWEKTYFQMLGTEILDDCMKPWDESMDDPQGLAYLSLTERRRRDEEKRQTKESMLAKTTKLKSSRYAWNTHEPELDNAEWQKLLHSWVQQTTNNCSPHIIDTPDIWDETAKPYIELRANRDINAGELVLSERTRSNVTTSIPEDVFENPNPPPSRHYYCDTCSCLMIVPRDCPITYASSTTQTPYPPPSPHHSASPTISTSSQDTANAAYGSDNSDFAHSPIIRSPPLPPILSPILPPATPPDLTFCAPTHPIPTCSPTCRIARLPFDTALHQTPLERTLRTSHLLPPLTPSRKKQCLIDLLLLRIFATALAENTHPLQDKDLLFANCGAGVECQNRNQNQKQDKEGERMWTFTNNVVRPIWIIDRVLEGMEMDQWCELEVCDGWVLTSLLEKIGNAMEVSRGASFAKVFDRSGMVERIVCEGEDGWGEVVGCGGEEVEGGGEGGGKGDGGVWSASIHPVLNMIRVADVARGERPNVRVLRREGMVCFAVGRSGREGEVAIRAREALVRGAELGGEEGKKGIEENMDMDVE